MSRMLWLTDKERLILTVLGLLALAGLGLNLWLQHRAPIAMESRPVPSSQETARWDALIQDARQIDVNHATAEELERLPEVGPVVAQRIIEYRKTQGPFTSPEDLRKVPGIGPKTFEALKDHVKVE